MFEGFNTQFDDVGFGNPSCNGTASSRVRRFAYLKEPNRIRAAMLNETGSAPSIATIERSLARLEKRIVGHKPAGEPLESDAVEYAPRKRPHGLNPVSRPLTKQAPSQFDPKEVEQVRRAANRLELEQVKQKLVKLGTPPAATLARKVLRSVCDGLSIDQKRVKGRSKKRAGVHARSIIYKLLREHDPELFTYPKLGRLFGRDHTSIIYAIEQFDVYCRQDARLWPLYKALGGQDG